MIKSTEFDALCHYRLNPVRVVFGRRKRNACFCGLWMNLYLIYSDKKQANHSYLHGTEPQMDTTSSVTSRVIRLQQKIIIQIPIASESMLAKCLYSAVSSLDDYQTPAR